MERNQGKKQPEKIYLALAVLAMLLAVVSLLLSSFQIAIYGDSKYGFYKKEYEKYEVTKALNMELSDVMEVTEYMMDYLIGREDVLSVETDVDGQRQDFFNEQDRLHMADVRGLFIGGLKIRTSLFITAVFLVGILAVLKTDLKSILPKAYGCAMAVFLAALVFVGIAASIDFTRCFRIFHEIFFTNDLWMFDESTDYMIRMLPEGFFSDMAFRIASVFAVSLLLLGGVILLPSMIKIFDKRTADEKNVV